MRVDAKQTESLDRLLCPKSVAVIGASRNPAKWGSRVLANTRLAGFRGDLFAVNPAFTRHGEGGFITLPDIQSLPAGVDCAIVALSREATPAVVHECAVAGVGAVVVVAAGFAEMGAAGADLQRQLQETVSKTGIRVLGPNCFGLFASPSAVNLTTLPDVPRGPIALVSQSGNVAIELWEIAKRRGTGFSYAVGVGNQMNVGFGELLAFLAHDPDTHAVAIYVEGLGAGCGDRFVDGLRQCRDARKPVVVLKAGQTRVGAAAVKTHTNALAGDQRIWDSVLLESGAINAESTEDMIDLLVGVTRLSTHRGRVAIVTDGGGCSALAADAVGRFGLSLATFDDSTKAQLEELIPPAAPRPPSRNPITLDTPGGMDDDPALLAGCAELIARDPNVDVVAIAGIFGGYSGLREREAEAAKRLVALARGGTRIAVQSAYPDSHAMTQLLEAGIPTFGTIRQLIRAVSAGHAGPPDASSGDDSSDYQGQPLPLTEVRALLVDYGVEVPELHVFTETTRLENALAAIEWPACLKIADPNVSHKSDVGGVVLGLDGPDAVYHSAVRLWHRFPGAPLLLMPQLASGFEMLVGCFFDSVFGPTVLIGRGGIWAEVDRDLVIVSGISADRSGIRSAISRLRCYPILSGARGQTPLDIDALVAVASRMASLSDAHRDVVVEVNPAFLYSTGRGIAIADIRGLQQLNG